MKYIKIKGIKILIVNTISLLAISCSNSKTQTDEALEMDEMIINVLDISTQRERVNATLEISNVSSVDYYLVDSYQGDLDNRSFPMINMQENNLIVDFKPFYSESVNRYYLENENNEPFIATGDEFGLQKIKSKDKRIITLNIPFNKPQVDELNIKLYFGKYLNNKLLSNAERIYIPPTKDFYNSFSFKEKLIRINKKT